MGYTFHGMNFGQFALWFFAYSFLDGQWSALLYASSSKDGRTEVLPGCLSVLYMDLAHLLRIIFLLRLSIIMWHFILQDAYVQRFLSILQPDSC